MEWTHFEPFSPIHFAVLFVCGAAPLLIPVFQRRFQDHGRVLKLGRRFLAISNLVVWLVACGFWFHPDYFRFEQSLPLQFCNLANLIAAVALTTQWRVAQSLLYFWTFALCIWAFLTPFLMVGPAHPWFWVFWLYHFFIPVSAAWILAVDRFRPEIRDWRQALIATFLYAASLAVLNALTGWNYGFLGSDKPGQPSLIDFLGPYPIRLLWMAMIGAFLFWLLLLPWIRPRKFPNLSP